MRSAIHHLVYAHAARFWPLMLIAVKHRGELNDRKEAKKQCETDPN